MNYLTKTTKNGIKVVLINGLQTNAVTVSAYLRSGFRFDPKNRPGIAHFTEHMVFHGTKSFPSSRTISEEIEKFGGWSSAITWIEHQKYLLHLPKTQFE